MLNMLRRLRACVLARSTQRNEFDRVVRDTCPPMTDAEMDRYVTYHRSNQHGR